MNPVPDLTLEAGSFVRPDGALGETARQCARPIPPSKMTTQRSYGLRWVENLEIVRAPYMVNFESLVLTYHYVRLR